MGNTGEQYGTTEYVLSIANEIIDRGEVRLDGGGSTYVKGQFDTASYDPQELSYRADMDDETASGSFELKADVDYEK